VVSIAIRIGRKKNEIERYAKTVFPWANIVGNQAWCRNWFGLWVFFGSLSDKKLFCQYLFLRSRNCCFRRDAKETGDYAFCMSVRRLSMDTTFIPDFIAQRIKMRLRNFEGRVFPKMGGGLGLLDTGCFFSPVRLALT